VSALIGIIHLLESTQLPYPIGWESAQPERLNEAFSCDLRFG
jgi:hypothetical protein